MGGNEPEEEMGVRAKPRLQAHLIGGSPKLRLHDLVEGDHLCLNASYHQREDVPTSNEACWPRSLIRLLHWASAIAEANSNPERREKSMCCLQTAIL